MDFERVLEGFWEAFGRGLGGIWSLMGNFLTVLWNCFSTLTTHSKLKMGSTEKKRFQERIWRGLGTFGNDFGEILGEVWSLLVHLGLILGCLYDAGILYAC